MIMQTEITSATDEQVKYVVDLAKSRVWQDVLSVTIATTVRNALWNVEHLTERPRRIELRAASAAISALRLCRTRETDPLQVLLSTVPISHYALPRTDTREVVWDFFSVIKSLDDRRYVVRLLGSPGDWKREHLRRRLQVFVAQHIHDNPHAAAVAYATQHGRCSVCDSPLSDHRSIARSMGPVCAKRFK